MDSLNRIEEARENLCGIIRPTPIIHSEYFSRMSGNEVHIKPEKLSKKLVHSRFEAHIIGFLSYLMRRSAAVLFVLRPAIMPKALLMRRSSWVSKRPL